MPNLEMTPPRLPKEFLRFTSTSTTTRTTPRLQYPRSGSPRAPDQTRSLAGRGFCFALLCFSSSAVLLEWNVTGDWGVLPSASLLTSRLRPTGNVPAGPLVTEVTWRGSNPFVTCRHWETSKDQPCMV